MNGCMLRVEPARNVAKRSGVKRQRQAAQGHAQLISLPCVTQIHFAFEDSGSSVQPLVGEFRPRLRFQRRETALGARRVHGGLGQAECLIVVPEDVTLVEAGTMVDVIDLRRYP